MTDIKMPDDVVEAAARALSEAELWPGVWSRLDSVVQDAFITQARAAIAAALNAWQGMEIRPTFNPTRIILPLSHEIPDD